MTTEEFRKIALSLPEAVESEHMNHPDFRVRGKIFATLAYPNTAWAMVRLPPRSQEEVIFAEPKVFSPVKGAWGRQGATRVDLKSAKKTSLRKAMIAAWRNVAPKDLAQQYSALK
jgi:hypothetical protein